METFNEGAKIITNAPNDEPLPTTVPFASGKASSSLATKREQKNLENIFAEQSVISFLEEQAVSDLTVPVVGLLAGSITADGSWAILKSVTRIEREGAELVATRRVIPNDSLTTVNRRIRDEGNAILGYYYSEVEHSSYSIDHGYISKCLQSFGSLDKLVVIRLRRILKGNIEDDIEAGVRVESFITRGDGQTLVPIPLRIMDTAYYPSTCVLTKLGSLSVEFEELLNQSRVVATWGINSDLEYDQCLSKRLRVVDSSSRWDSWNFSCRAASDTLNLKRLIYERLSDIEQQWSHRTACEADVAEEVVENGMTSPRLSSLLGQLLLKELSIANSDSLKRLPVSSHISFYERPTISMKAPRSSSPTNGAQVPKKKRAGLAAQSKGTTTSSQKSAPRAILPATSSLPPIGSRSLTPSMEFEVREEHQLTEVIAESLLLASAPQTKVDPNIPNETEIITST